MSELGPTLTPVDKVGRVNSTKNNRYSLIILSSTEYGLDKESVKFIWIDTLSRSGVYCGKVSFSKILVKLLFF